MAVLETISGGVATAQLVLMLRDVVTTTRQLYVDFKHAGSMHTDLSTQIEGTKQAIEFAGETLAELLTSCPDDVSKSVKETDKIAPLIENCWKHVKKADKMLPKREVNSIRGRLAFALNKAKLVDSLLELSPVAVLLCLHLSCVSVRLAQWQIRHPKDSSQLPRLDEIQKAMEKHLDIVQESVAKLVTASTSVEQATSAAAAAASRMVGTRSLRKFRPVARGVTLRTRKTSTHKRRAQSSPASPYPTSHNASLASSTDLSQVSSQLDRRTGSAESLEGGPLRPNSLPHSPVPDSRRVNSLSHQPGPPGLPSPVASSILPPATRSPSRPSAPHREDSLSAEESDSTSSQNVADNVATIGSGGRSSSEDPSDSDRQRRPVKESEASSFGRARFGTTSRHIPAVSISSSESQHFDDGDSESPAVLDSAAEVDCAGATVATGDSLEDLSHTITRVISERQSRRSRDKGEVEDAQSALIQATSICACGWYNTSWYFLFFQRLDGWIQLALVPYESNRSAILLEPILQAAGESPMECEITRQTSGVPRLSLRVYTPPGNAGHTITECWLDFSQEQSGCQWNKHKTMHPSPAAWTPQPGDTNVAWVGQGYTFSFIPSSGELKDIYSRGNLCESIMHPVKVAMKSGEQVLYTEQPEARTMRVYRFCQDQVTQYELQQCRDWRDFEDKSHHSVSVSLEQKKISMVGPRSTTPPATSWVFGSRHKPAVGFFSRAVDEAIYYIRGHPWYNKLCSPKLINRIKAGSNFIAADERREILFISPEGMIKVVKYSVDYYGLLKIEKRRPLFSKDSLTLRDLSLQSPIGYYMRCRTPSPTRSRASTPPGSSHLTDSQSSHGSSERSRSEEPIHRMTLVEDEADHTRASSEGEEDGGGQESEDEDEESEDDEARDGDDQDNEYWETEESENHLEISNEDDEYLETEGNENHPEVSKRG